MLVNGIKIGTNKDNQCSSKSCFNHVKTHPMNIGLFSVKHFCTSCLIKKANNIVENSKIKAFA